MKKTTYSTYLMFLFIGFIFTIAGVIPGEIAATFGIKDSDVVLAFTFFTIGTTSAILLNGILLDKLTPKKETLISFALIFIGITGMITATSIYIFSLFLTMCGFGVGFLISFGNYLIINMYEKERAKKLNILNFYYSLGAVAGPVIAGYLLKNLKLAGKEKIYSKFIFSDRIWIYIYILIVCMAAIIFILLITRDYSKFKKAKKEEKENIKWGKNTYIMATVIFLYVLSEMTITYWIVTYLKERVGFSEINASKMLSVIWFFMMIGRFISGKMVDYFNPEKYIKILGIISIIGLSILIFSKSNINMGIAAVIIGIGYSGLYATILTYGTQQVKVHSTKLMTFYITCGSAGGILANPISSLIKKNFGVTFAMGVSLICVIVIVILTELTKKRKFPYKEYENN